MAKAKNPLAKYDKKFLHHLLEQMLQIRRFEEKAAQMYGLQKIGGFCHLYIGQEAVAVGSIATLDLTTDYVVTAYRDHGHALAVGMSMDECMAELYGKRTGCAKGKGGSMHFFSAEKNFLGGNGIVGGQIPVATGAALKIAYNDEKGVVLCYFGDGAVHQGTFHESLNLAKIWDLPIVYIIENNQYGMGTNFQRVSAVDDFSVMGASYGFPGKQVDGMNVLTVYEELSEAVAQARDKRIPSLLEIKTYRYRGHSMSDPAKYRTREELKQYKEQDPILILKSAMLEAEMLTNDEFDKIDKRQKESAQAAVDFAENSPEPELHELYEDILA
jgi:pyruvate dehydrogenase E1 component alpha subunit